MNTTRLSAGAVSLLSLVAVASACAQGSLTPPGPPNPTMKGIDQIASTGIAISAVNTPGDGANLYIIKFPGTYFLTATTSAPSGKNGILISSGNVTVELNGFGLFGGGGVSVAITDGGVNHGNAIIRNGTIFGWGGAGVDLSHSFDSVISDLIVTNNGGAGLTVGDACVMRNCMSRDNGGDNVASGFNANVEHCTAVGSATGNGFNLGPDSSMFACVANFNAHSGVSAASGCNLSYCSASQNVAGGIVAQDGAVLTGCNAYLNSNVGLQTGKGAVLANCGAYQNGTSGGSTAAAIAADFSSQLINCNACNNFAAFGIQAASGAHLVHCLAADNTSNAAVSAGITIAGGRMSDCVAKANLTTNGTPGPQTGMGVYANFSSIENCLAESNMGDGINVIFSCLIRGNNAYFNGLSGIHATGSGNQIERNLALANGGNGIWVDSTVSLIMGNTARGNLAGHNFVIVAGNRVGAIVLPAVTVTDITGNTGGTNFSTDPMNNIAY
jgi:hypothetical protein